jgi:hypothetical protein
MSDLAYFKDYAGIQAVKLPFALDAMIDDWQRLRFAMVKAPHPDFNRTEWAYLIQFVDPYALRAVFADAFGAPTAETSAKRLLTPVSRVALWLPNNVSLLGPLVMVMLSLTGTDLRIKVGSRSRNLCLALLDWLRDKAPDGPLKSWLVNRVTATEFDRTDPRNTEMAAWADVRILFGSDAAAAAVEALPHPFASSGFYFGDKVSEVWIEPDAITPALATDLAKVFGVYGQAGCTSPKRVAIIDGRVEDAERLARTLAEVWPAAQPEQTPRHVASESIMAEHWARAQGKQAVRLPQNAGTLIIEPAGEVGIQGHMVLSLQWGTVDEALQTQPANIQSIGHAVSAPESPHWQEALVRSAANRFVPLARMHHFGAAWDGMPWWKNLFNLKLWG